MGLEASSTKGVSGAETSSKKTTDDLNSTNKPTDESFKVRVRTQFGDDIIVYGLTEDSTMQDIEKQIDETHGSSWPLNDIEKTDLKLKELAIKPNDTVVWSTAYSKGEATLSEEVSALCLESMKETAFHRKVSIDKLLKGDKDELKLCGKLLELRGWCFVKYPNELRKHIDSVSNSVNVEMAKEDKKWGKIGDVYGYSDHKDYKEVLRVITGSLMNKYGDRYPDELQDDLKSVSRRIDRLAVDLMTVFATNESVFGFESVDEFIAKSREEESNVTILSGFDGREELKCGLLDFVRYKNLKKEESEYPRIKDRGQNVGAHTDPGLFTLSFMSTAPGLQLYDGDCWREKIDNECGVLWCGEAAPKISSGKIKAGIHRVMFNGDQPRFTAWYEASVDAQLTKAIVK